MNFDKELFYCEIAESDCIMDVVGLFEGQPAVVREFTTEPVETYVSLCEFAADFTGKCNDIATQTYDVKIVAKKGSSKSDLLNRFEIFHTIMIYLKFDGLAEVIKEDLQNRVLTDPNTGRHYISSVYSVRYVY